MKSRKLHALKALALGLILASVQALAITSSGQIEPKETPILLNGFYTQLAEHKKRYETEDVEHFFFSFKDNADAAVSELLIPLSINPGSRKTDILTANEFLKIKKNLKKRGYEPSKNLYCAPPEDLVINYSGIPGAKPQGEPGKKPAYYLHEMKWELRENYQPKGKILKGHDLYPRAVAMGYIFLRCEKPYADCRLANISFDTAGISWESVPGTREGGNSSAGGGK